MFNSGFRCTMNPYIYIDSYGNKTSIYEKDIGRNISKHTEKEKNELWLVDSEGARLEFRGPRSWKGRGRSMRTGILTTVHSSRKAILIRNLRQDTICWSIKTDYNSRHSHYIMSYTKRSRLEIIETVFTLRSARTVSSVMASLLLSHYYIGHRVITETENLWSESRNTEKIDISCLLCRKDKYWRHFEIRKRGEYVNRKTGNYHGPWEKGGT
jgi:hypothetical protein